MSKQAKDLIFRLKEAAIIVGCIECLEAATRIAELEVIVKTLPKTADGVPVVIGGHVWFNLRHGPTEAEVIPLFETEMNGMMDCDYDGCHPCYSTRAAAEQAKEGGA